MLRIFFTAIFLLISLLLLMCCAMCQSAHGENTVETAPKQIILFEPGKGEIKKKVKGSPDTEQYHSFTFPSLSFVKDVFVVFAQATNNTGTEKKCDIVEGFFKINDDGTLANRDSEGRVEIEHKKQITANDEKKCAENPTAVVDQEKIYAFFKSTGDDTAEQLEYKVIDGDVTGIKTENGILWKTPENIRDTLEAEDLTSITSIDSGGPGIVVNKTLLIPVMYTKDNKDYFISLITNLTGDSSKKRKLVMNKPAINGKYPTIVKWEGKLIMMTTNKEGLQKMYGSTDMGTTWKDNAGFILSAWKNTKERKNHEYSGKNALIKIDFDNEKKKVMLFTQPVKHEDENYKLHLWMTNYRQMYDVGVILDNVKDDVSSALLYANEKLFVAYEKWNSDRSTIYSVYLKTQLEEIQKIVEKWTKQDDYLSKSCFEADGRFASGDKCTNNEIPTDGLVGFLFGNYENNNKWVDEYWCVNASVTRDKGTVTKATNGLQFSGTGAGATWPVTAQGQNQRYHFANYAFTLVATVTIDGNAGIDMFNSILGIGLKQPASAGATNNIGLLCDEHNKFVVNYKTETPSIETETNCVLSKTYIIALVLKGENLEIYVDGIKLTLPNEKIGITKTETIEHFYFGAASGSKTLQKTAVTVSNVLLYNWPFDNEIEKLKPKRNEEKIVQTQPGNENTKPETPDQNTQGNKDVRKDTKTGGTENEEEENKQSSPPPPTTEDSAVRVGVDVLSLLFGVFTLLGRYVY